MKNKNLILYILILLIILPFTSCNKNCDHVFINKTFISQPTCETHGKVLKQCKKCKYEETEVLVALGHDYVYETLIEPTCFSNGLQRGVCRRDVTHIIEKSLDKTEHNFINYIDDNNASLKQNGTKTAVCENEGCNEIDIKVIENSMEKDFNNDSFFYDLLTNILDSNYTINLKNCKIEDEELDIDNITLTLTYNEDSNSFIGNGYYNQYQFSIYNEFVYVKENEDILYKLPLEKVKVEEKSLDLILSLLDSSYFKTIDLIKRIIGDWPSLTNKLIKNIIFETFDIVKNENDYVFSLNFDLLKSLNEKLKNMNVFEFSSYYLIGNLVSRIHKNIKNILNTKVEDLLNSDEFDIFEVLKFVDEFVFLLTNGKYSTLEQYLLIEKEINLVHLDEIFEDEKYLKSTFIEAISSLSKISTSALNLAISTMFLNLENKNIYELIGLFIGLTKDELYLLINDFIEQSKTGFSLEFNVSFDRKLIDVNISIDENSSCKFTLNENKTDPLELVNLVNQYIFDVDYEKIKYDENYKVHYDINYNYPYDTTLDYLILEEVTYYYTYFDYSNEKFDVYGYEKHYDISKFYFDDFKLPIKYDMNKKQHYIIFSEVPKTNYFAMGKIYYRKNNEIYKDAIVCGYEFETIYLYNVEVHFSYN